MKVPIPTVDLFPVLDIKLLELLRSLNPDDWTKPTRAKLWCVKDVASHLLDGNFRTISMIRDSYFGEKPSGAKSYQDLVNFLNGLNADWVKATKRLSPSVLIELLESTGKEYNNIMRSLDPFAPAIFSVAWAGEEQSLNWFHIAREYTEKWHHQQQIREAVNLPGIMERELYFPVLDTFMRALPHAFRNTPSPEGTSIKLSIAGNAGGDWYLQRQPGGWSLIGQTIDVVTSITIDEHNAWKLLTKGLSEIEAEMAVQITGNPELGKPVLLMRSVMA